MHARRRLAFASLLVVTLIAGISYFLGWIPGSLPLAGVTTELDREDVSHPTVTLPKDSELRREPARRSVTLSVVDDETSVLVESFHHSVDSRAFVAVAGGRVTIDDLPAEQVAVVVRAPGYRETNFTITTTQSQWTLRLCGAARLYGIVRDTHAGPLGEVEVFVAERGRLHGFRRTSQDGAYDFVGLPSGNYDVRFSKQGFEVHAESVAIDGAKQLDVTLDTVPMLSVSIVATPPTVKVTGSSSLPAIVMLDSVVVYEQLLHFEDGIATAQVVDDRGATEVLCAITLPSGRVAHARGAIRTHEKRRYALLRLDDCRWTTFEFRSRGDVLAGRQFRARSGATVTTVMTDDRGFAFVPSEDVGRDRIVFWSGHGVSETMPIDGGMHVVDMGDHGGRVVVIGEESARAVVCGCHGEGEFTQQDAAVDPAGAYWVPAGEFQVQNQDHRGILAGPTAIRVGQELTVDLDRQTTGACTGVTRAHATVSVWHGSDVVGWSRVGRVASDGDGRFGRDRLHAGPYCAVTRDAHRLAFRHFVIDGAAAVDLGDMTRTREFDIELRDRRYRSVASTRLRICASGVPSEEALDVVTDADGRFEVELSESCEAFDLWADTWRIHVDSRGGKTRYSVVVPIAEAEARVFRLDPALVGVRKLWHVDHAAGVRMMNFYDPMQRSYRLPTTAGLVVAHTHRGFVPLRIDGSTLRAYPARPLPEISGDAARGPVLLRRIGEHELADLRWEVPLEDAGGAAVSVCLPVGATVSLGDTAHEVTIR